MRLSVYFCLINLIILGICGGIFAFTGFNLLLFLCLGNILIYKSVLSVFAVCALFLIFATVKILPRYKI